MRKLSDKEMILSYQLFIGKVAYELGFDKTWQLLKEAKEAILKTKNED